MCSKKKRISYEIDPNIEEQLCISCLEIKPISEFTFDKYTKGGYCRYCKDCKSIKRAERYLKYRKNMIKHHREYNATEQGKAKNREHWKKYYEKHRIEIIKKNRNKTGIARKKGLVNSALLNAVARYGFPRPNKCSICGKICKPQGHHENYDEPFKVVWLCANCHVRYHRSGDNSNKIKRLYASIR